MTKRTKRTKKILNSLIASLLFVVSVSVSAAGFDNRDRGCNDIRAEVFRQEADFSDREVRFYDRENRIDARDANRFERNFETFAYRAERQDSKRKLDKADIRLRDTRIEKQRDDREIISRTDRESSRLDNQFASRFDVDRAERSFVAEREGRCEADLGFSSDRVYGLARVDG
jgi:hypothetical protein